MHQIVRNAVFLIAHWLLLFRYRLEIKGIDNLKIDPHKGILFLPNHSAEIDPVMLVTTLKKKFGVVKPLAVDTFYFQPGIKFCMDLAQAVPVPNFDLTSNRWKQKRIDKAFHTVAEDLKAGHNYLIYPAGRLKSDGREVIGGASFVPKLLELYPDVNIVLVRVTGLWGSLFSRAITGKTPSFGEILLKGIKIVLKNAIFFTPKRKILIEFVSASPDFPRRGNRLEINQYLENWYNRYRVDSQILPEEPITLVSFSLWKREVPEILSKKKKEAITAVQIPDQVKAEVLPFLAKLSSIHPSKITPQKELAKDLGLDSLEIAEIHVFLSERFDAPSISPGMLNTVEDVLKIAAGAHFESHYEEKASESLFSLWRGERRRPIPLLPEGKTIADVFIKSCDRMKNTIACADRVLGVFTYKRLKKAAFVLSSFFEKFEEERIGILFPASASAYLLVFACLLAKKVPVLLNWTTGPRALNTAVEIGEIKRVISSRKFLDRLNVPDLGKLEEMIYFIEELKSTISIKDKLKGSFRALKKQHTFAQDENAMAVLLFTSGTESYPKAVPLSHRNLLENQRGLLRSATYSEKDILAAILPPFHSFGFTVTGLLPLLSGIKVFYAPDPTDSYGLIHDCRDFKPTIFCAAPSFYKGLFKVGKREDFQSIRLFVTGAEKTPLEFFEIVKGFGENKQLLEGYGITECSPVVTLNRENEPPRGVGYPLPGVSLIIIHPETNEKLMVGQTGEICVNGPNVFNGYLGQAKDPFIHIDGKKWYRTGDLGYIDETGALILSGRLKRFVKIAGEMISLMAIEEELEKAALKKGWTAPSDAPLLSIAIRKREENRPLLILFTTFKIDAEKINECLQEAGFSPLIKIFETRQLEQIPLTATGKTNYRLLDSLLDNA